MSDTKAGIIALLVISPPIFALTWFIDTHTATFIIGMRWAQALGALAYAMHALYVVCRARLTAKVKP